VTVQAKMTCDGMVVLSDTYYPGWDAKIDGQPVEIHEVDFAFRGVVVSRGTHQITFRYRPGSFVVGVVLTLAGLLAAALITIFGQNRDREEA